MLQVQKEQEDSSGYLTDDNKNTRKSNANGAMTVAEEFSSSMKNERSCNYMTHFILANSTNNCTINNSNSNNYERTNNNRSTNILDEAELIMKKLEHEKVIYYLYYQFSIHLSSLLFGYILFHFISSLY